MPDDPLDLSDIAEPAAPRRRPADLSDPLDTIAHYESGDTNVPNYRYDRGHTAQGHYQITNTNWRKHGPAIGVDLTKYPNAMAAPKEVQRNVANTMFQKRGFDDWAPYNPALRAGLQRGEGQGKPAPAQPSLDLEDIKEPPAKSAELDLSDITEGGVKPAVKQRPAAPKITSLAEAKQADEARIQAVDKLSRDIAWHFGDSVLNQFPDLPEDRQIKIARMATQYAAADEAKKRAGQPIVESYKWKADNQRLVGVKGDSVTDRGEMMMRQQGLTNEDLAKRRDDLTASTNPLLQSTGVMRWLKETGAHGTAGLLNAVAGAARLSSGASPVGMAAKDAADRLQEKSRQLQGVTAQAETRAPMGGAAQAASGLGAGLIEFLPLMALGHPELSLSELAGAETLGAVAKIAAPSVAAGAASFGGYTGLQAYGGGATPGEALKAGAKAAPFGALMGVPGSVFGNAVDSGLKNAVTSTLIKGAGYYGIGRAEGMTPEEARDNALALSAFAGPELAGEVLNAVIGRAVRKSTVPSIDQATGRPMEPAVKSAIDSAFEVAGVSPELAEKALKTPVVESPKPPVEARTALEVREKLKANRDIELTDHERAMLNTLMGAEASEGLAKTARETGRVTSDWREQVTPEQHVADLEAEAKQRRVKLAQLEGQGQAAEPNVTPINPPLGTVSTAAQQEKVRAELEHRAADIDEPSPDRRAQIAAELEDEMGPPTHVNGMPIEKAAAESPASKNVASVPFMITKRMEADLRGRGYSQGDIDKFTPQQAHDILAQPSPQAEAAKLTALPRELAGAKPRYSYRDKRFELIFDDDFDKAAYISAQSKRSKADAAYVQWAAQQSGMPEADVRAHGQKVKDAVKAMAKGEDEGTLNVPKQRGGKGTAVSLNGSRYVRSGNDWLYDGKQKVTNPETIAKLDAKLKGQRGSIGEPPQPPKPAPPGVKTGAVADRAKSNFEDIVRATEATRAGVDVDKIRKEWRQGRLGYDDAITALKKRWPNAPNEKVFQKVLAQETSPLIGVLAKDGQIKVVDDPRRALAHGIAFAGEPLENRWRYEPANKTVYWSNDASEGQQRRVENYLADQKQLEVKKHSSLSAWRNETNKIRLDEESAFHKLGKNPQPIQEPTVSKKAEPIIGIVASDGTVRGRPDPGRNLDHGRVFPEVWSTGDHWHYEPSTETVYWTAGNASPEAKHAAENFLDRKGLDVKRHSDYMTYLQDTKDLSDRLEGMTEDELVANIFQMEGRKPAPSALDTLQRSMEGKGDEPHGRYMPDDELLAKYEARKAAEEHPSATQPRTPETGQFSHTEDYRAVSAELFNAGKRMQGDYARLANHPARRDLSTASDLSVRNYFRQLYNFVNTHEPDKLPLVRQAEAAQYAGDSVKATIFSERALSNTHDFANELNNAVLATRMMGEGKSIKASTDWRGVLRTVRERTSRAEMGFRESVKGEEGGFIGEKPEDAKPGPEGVRTGAVADLEAARREKERRLPKHLERTGREPGEDLTYQELPGRLTKARVEKRIADQGLDATEDWYMKQQATHPEEGAELTDAYRQLSDHYLTKLVTADNPADIARFTAKAKELAGLEVPRSTGLGQAVQAYAMLDKYTGPEVLLEATRLAERAGEQLPDEIVKDIAKTGQEFKAADEQLTEVRKELAKEEKGLGPGKGPGKGAGMGKRMEQLLDEQTKLIEKRQQAKIRQERTLAKLERPSTKLDYYLRFNNIVRGFMVSAIPTAVRNYETQGLRFGIERLTDLFAHGMRKAASQDPGISAANIHRDMLRLFQSESRSKAVAIAGEYPKELRRLFATYGGGQVETAQAAKTFGGRVEKAFGSVENFVQHINWLNQLQEFHIRGAEFLSHLDMLVEREHGPLLEKLRRELPSNSPLKNKGLELFLHTKGADRLSKEMIKDSVDHALEVTFADLPASDTRIGQHMNALIKIGNLIPPTVSPIPFARWFYNAWKFNYQFSPLGLADLARTPRQLREARRALQRVELRPPARTETMAARRTVELEKARANVTRLEEAAKIGRYKTVAKAAIGSTFLLGAYAARSSPLAGEKWYEMYIPGTNTLIDMRPFAPFSTYLFLAEGARRMIHKERPYSKNEFFAGLGASTAQTGGMEVLYDKYRRGDFASLTRAMQSAGSDLGTAILTPVRQIRDLIGEFDKSQSTTYDTGTQPFAGPLKTSIPYGERIGENLPKAYKPLSDEPIHGTHPATKFLGPRIITPKNFVEKEADRLRFDFNEVRPATGVPEVDQLEEQWMGEYVGKQATKLSNNPNYARMPDSAKAQLYLKPLFAAGRTVARARLATEHPGLYMKLIERSKSSRQRAMENDFGVKPLASPY